MSNIERAVAVDVGGTNVRAALVEKQQGKAPPVPEIVDQARLPLDKSSPEALLTALAECVSKVCPGSGGAKGIGVAMKGFVDPSTGITVGSAYLGMRGLPVGPKLSERFGLPVRIANDVQAATIGEMFYGAGRELSEFVYLNVGTGIAIGLVLGRRLYRGAANLSGEFGHVTVKRDGWPCTCGRKGCLEAVVSGPGIAKQARREAERHPESRLAERAAAGNLTATAVFELADGGDEAAGKVMRHSAEYLGDAIANLINVLNPQGVILGGGVFSGARSFVEHIERYVRTVAIDEDVEHLRTLGMSELQVDKAGLIGAAALVFEGGKFE